MCIFWLIEIPNSTLSVLEVNGKKICHSIAIAHYLAEKAGLCGNDDMEAAVAEMIVHTVYDLTNSILHLSFLIAQNTN